MARIAVTDEDLRREYELQRGPRRLTFEQAIVDRALRICLTNLAEIRKRRAAEAAAQLELTPGCPVIEFALFASCFCAVFFLGLQSLNVNQGHYLAAFLTSFAIGGSHLALYRYMPDPSLTQVAAYLMGGPFGIVASMWIHQRTIGRRRREIDISEINIIAGRPVSRPMDD